jgi:hypothetical protein
VKWHRLVHGPMQMVFPASPVIGGSESGITLYTTLKVVNSLYEQFVFKVHCAHDSDTMIHNTVHGSLAFSTYTSI